MLFDYNDEKTFNNIIPLGLVPYTEYNKKLYKLKYKKNINNRTFITTQEINIKLSDDRIIKIPEGFLTDLMSVPSWCWSFLKPFDVAFIGDLIHDYLYVNKMEEIKHFEGRIYKAQKFADSERNKWRKKITKYSKTNKLGFKNWLTNFMLNVFAKDFYNRKYIIPD